MRFGGLIGLTWQDVDFENEQIRTYRSLNTLTHKFTPPKHKTSNCKLLHIDWQQLPRPIKNLLEILVLPSFTPLVFSYHNTKKDQLLTLIRQILVLSMT